VLGDEEQAIEAGKTLIKLYPDEGNHYDSYGHVLMNFRRYDEAIENFERAIEIDPNGFYVNVSYFRKAECHEAIGEYDEAIESAEKSREIANKKLPIERLDLGYDIDTFIRKVREKLRNEREFLK